MAEVHEKQATDLVTQAERKLRSFSLFSGRSQKYEDAAGLYKAAANKFKLAKRWQEAGDAFLQAAQLSEKARNMHDATLFRVDAANCFKKIDPHRAIEQLRNAATMHCEEGRFLQAAKLQKEIGELYESELDFKNAIENYQLAADYYSGEEAQTSGNQCRAKIAQFCAQLEQYPRAIEIFESIATQSMDVPLLKWGVKDYLFKAGLCHLAATAQDISNLDPVRRAIEKYCDIDYNFDSSRECQLLKEVVEAVDQGDVDKFTEAVYQYDNVCKLDPWKTTLLLRLKKAMTEGTSLT